MRYKYTGDQPALLIDYHIEVQPNDIVTIDGPVNNPNLVPVESDKKQKTNEEAVN